MTDDHVKQALAELQDVVRCRCHPAYTGRGLHDPDCECDNAEAVKAVSDRIKELEAKLENLLGGAETVLEAWDSGNEASFREAIEGMRADVEAAKGSKDE